MREGVDAVCAGGMEQDETECFRTDRLPSAMAASAHAETGNTERETKNSSRGEARLSEKIPRRTTWSELRQHEQTMISRASSMKTLRRALLRSVLTM